MLSGDKNYLAILASGTGSNADKICHYFHDHPDITVSLILTNREAAGVREVAARHHVDCIYIPKAKWIDKSHVSSILEAFQITHIVLAGFLLLIPDWLVHMYSGRIINIHPALLPKYGGPGMYGMHVHRAVKAGGESVSGITIHEVDEKYDEGPILFQREVILDPADTPEDIARKVLQLEHKYYPRVVEKWVRNDMSGISRL